MNGKEPLNIIGRIKGYKDGFQKTDWRDVVFKQNTYNKYIFPITIILQVSIGIYLFGRSVRRWKDRGENFGTLEYVIGGMGLSTVAIFLYFAWETYQPFLFGVAWVS